MDEHVSQLVLCQISENCPRALATYLMCFNSCDPDLQATFTKQVITDDKNMSWARFQNDLRALARQGLLEWHRMDTTISVTLAEQEDI